MPASTTKRTPGTVSDVSATFVLSTMRRPRCGWKMRCCSADDNRAYSGSTSVSRQIAAAQGVSGVVDLPLAGEEHEHVAGTSPLEFGDGVDDRLHLIPVVTDGPVVDLHRVGPASDLDDRRVHAVGGEVAGEAGSVDRRRRHDDGEVGSPWQQLAEITEDEVDVEAALVGLVDDQRVVAAQHRVALDLGEEDAVRHHADERVVADAVVEAHGVPDGGADRRAQLTGEALGDRAGGDTAGLGVPDQPGDAASGLDAQLGQLRALARTGLAGDDQHLVPADGSEQLVVPGGDR